MPVSFFYDDMPQEIAVGQPSFAEAAQASFDQDDLAKRETLELVRAYYKVKDALLEGPRHPIGGA